MKASISLAAVSLMIALAVLPAAVGEQTSEWEGGDKGFRFVSALTTGGVMEKNITLPRNSEVSGATLRIQGDYYIMDEGQEYQTLHWPVNPSMDLFADGSSEWAFQGTMGMQTVFASNFTEEDLRWDAPGQTRTMDFTLPRSTIRAASLTINNSDTRKFSYSMSLGGNTFWSKESLSFSYSGTSFTRDTLTSVVTGDVNGDLKPEMVAGSANGKVYVAKNVGGKWLNATVWDLQIQAAQRDILGVALGALDDTPGLDIIAACADGNVYYLLNQGGQGLFSGANQLLSGTSSRMSSVCVADVNTDNSPDIVAGNLNGRFYVFMNDQGMFDPGGPDMMKVVPGGAGQMNAVTVTDINGDTIPDLIGANSNKNFYIALGTGSQNNFANGLPVITTASRDMNSVVVEDVNGDTYADLIGAGNDGRIYICINLGGQGYDAGTFDTQPGHIIKITCESGTNNLRTASVKDVNGDGLPDIVALGTSNQGQVFIAINVEGAFPDDMVMRPFSSGQSSKSLAVDDIDKDGDMDIVVTNGLRMDVYVNNQGKFSDVLTGPGFVNALQDYVNGAPPEVDQYGNPVIIARLQIANRYTGALHFSDLAINYSYSALVDITGPLSDYMNTTAGPYSEGEMVHIPVLFKMESAGALNIGDLNIFSNITLVPIIDNPAENSTVYTNQEMTLTGRSNKDMDGTYFNYTWTDIISGRLLGYGNMRVFKPTTKGNFTIQLRVLDQLHEKEATLSVHFQVVDQPTAVLGIAKVVLSNRSPKEGESVSIKVFVKNTGKVNATHVGFQIYLDKVKGNPIAAEVIPRVDIARTNSTEVFWDATDPGDHQLVIKIVTCDQPFVPGQIYKSPISVQPLISMDVVPIIAAIIGVAVVLGVIGFVIKRRRDHAAMKREQLEKLAADQRVAAPEQGGPQPAYGAPNAASVATDLTLPPSPQVGQELYAADRSSEAAQRYAAAAEAVAVHTTKFTCPRCGKSTDAEGLLCLECSARDAVDKAKLAIDEANEMALDVDHAQDLMKKAQADFVARKFADVIEAATKAEEEARNTKEAFDEATSIHGAGAKGAIGPMLGQSMKYGLEEEPKPRPEAPKPAAPAAPAAVPAAATAPPAPAAAPAAPAPPRPVIVPPTAGASAAPAAPASPRPVISPPAAVIHGAPAAPASPRPVIVPPAITHGAPAASTPSRPVIAPPAAAAHSYTNCPKCGKTVQPRWRICPNCQTKLT